MTHLPDLRVGHGYDVHRLTEGRPLVLGGVTVPYERGLLGHSDADVLVHAILDALIGAMGLGDIGKHFPDTEEAYHGINSLRLAEQVNDLLVTGGYQILNIDATVIAQRPKLAPYIDAMKANLAAVFELSEDRVNIKATTEEHLGFTGSGEGMASHAVCLIAKTDP